MHFLFFFFLEEWLIGWGWSSFANLGYQQTPVENIVWAVGKAINFLKEHSKCPTLPPQTMREMRIQVLVYAIELKYSKLSNALITHTSIVWTWKKKKVGGLSHTHTHTNLQ